LPKYVQMNAISDTSITPTAMSSKRINVHHSAKTSVRINANSRPATQATVKALSANSRRGARGRCQRPMLSSIKPSVRQAAATMGQVMVIQFMAQYRWLCLLGLSNASGAIRGRRNSGFYASNQRVNLPPECPRAPGPAMEYRPVGRVGG
jgi:hypothetical protein